MVEFNRKIIETEKHELVVEDQFQNIRLIVGGNVESCLEVYLNF